MGEFFLLLELEIRDFALIDQLSIQFNKGLNILTGETGAGKSIIIDAVNMAIGERSDRQYVRSGANKAVIQAIFGIENSKHLHCTLDQHQLNLDNDNILVITREIYSTGRSISRINGVVVNQSILKSITEKLIDIHGQHEHQSLFNTEFHINLLDMYGGEHIAELLKTYSTEYKKYIYLQQELNKFNYDEMEKERKIDLLKFQLDEIDSAKLQTGEEDILNQESELLANSEKIYSALSMSYQQLYNSHNELSVLDIISKNVKSFQNISSLDSSLDYFHSALEDIQYRIEDITTDIRNYRERIEFNPQLLQEIEKRLDIIHNLKRKYGSSIKEILQYGSDAKGQLDEILYNAENIKGLNDKLIVKNKILEKLADGSKKATLFYPS